MQKRKPEKFRKKLIKNQLHTLACKWVLLPKLIYYSNDVVAGGAPVFRATATGLMFKGYVKTKQDEQTAIDIKNSYDGRMETYSARLTTWTVRLTFATWIAGELLRFIT